MIIDRPEGLTTAQRRLALSLQDGDGWGSGLARIGRAARSDLDLGRDGGIDGARMSAMRQLRVLREMRARQMRSDAEEERMMMAAGSGGVGLEAGDPCPLLAEEYQMLDDLHGAAPALDLELKLPGHYAAPSAVPPLLRPGQRFDGSQSFHRGCPGTSNEDWGVFAQIEECNWRMGYICGTMTAVNVPQTEGSVSTFFEGNIVGVGSHTFLTSAWGATRRSDQHHWLRFPPFQRIQRRAANRAAELAEDGDARPLGPEPPSPDVVFMRWKEKSFETDYGETCGLTIAGFYYMCLDCTTGELDGFYHDSASQPFQKISLKATAANHGYSCSAYKFR